MVNNLFTLVPLCSSTFSVLQSCLLLFNNNVILPNAQPSSSYISCILSISLCFYLLTKESLFCCPTVCIFHWLFNELLACVPTVSVVQTPEPLQSLLYRATIILQFGCMEPLLSFSLVVWSPYYPTVWWLYGATISPSVWLYGATIILQLGCMELSEKRVAAAGDLVVVPGSTGSAPKR